MTPSVPSPIHEVMQSTAARPGTPKSGRMYFVSSAPTYSKRPNGNWNIAPIERTGGLWYLVSESKKNLCGELIATDFSEGMLKQANKNCEQFININLSDFSRNMNQNQNSPNNLIMYSPV